jgi:16S rRNA (guanine(966)-N(2))-methyltransferase RsmD
MRIITGLYKGRAIKTVGDLSVRPATDRVRQTLFNMLETRIAMEGAAVLDLFAGSGSLGLEALSRGASSVVFVEGNRKAAGYLEETLRTFGCHDAAEVVCEDALAFLAREVRTFDLVFADPPYAYKETKELPGLLIGRGIIRPGGYLLIEHARPLTFTSTDLYTAGPEKRFGRTTVTFFQGISP